MTISRQFLEILNLLNSIKIIDSSANMDKMIQQLVETDSSDDDAEDKTWKNGGDESDSERENRNKKRRMRSKSAPKRPLKDLINLGGSTKVAKTVRQILKPPATPNVLFREKSSILGSDSGLGNKAQKKHPKAVEIIRKSLEVLCRRIPSNENSTNVSSSSSSSTNENLENAFMNVDGAGPETYETILAGINEKSDQEELTRVSLRLYKFGFNKH